MKELLLKLAEALGRGEGAVLCVLVATEGSSPRKAGAKMLVTENGQTLGTVGGGKVEYLAAQEARGMLPDAPSRVREYELGSGSGMVCGGKAWIAFRAFVPAEEDLVREWTEALRGDAVWRFEPGAVREKDVTMRPGKDIIGTKWENGVYAEAIAHPDRVLLFGGGHVGQALVPQLRTVGFSVTVLDERAELAVPENFPAAESVICADFKDIRRFVAIGPDDYVVVMSPGHQSDFAILSQVLLTHATYIGCMGSRRKVASMREALAAVGFSEDEIARVHTPIGLAIKAETPEEIAVSIAAEMICHRAGRREA